MTNRHFRYVFFLLMICAGVNAQQEAACRTKLESTNKISPFPEVQTDDYTKCLDVLETYFYSIGPAVKKNNDRIEKLKSALSKSKKNLSSASATKTDSANYKELELATPPEIKALTDSNAVLVSQKDKYKATLKESLNKIIDLFHNTNNADETVYRAKLAKLNAAK
ncbi:MAG: hypothetical protein ABJB86_10945 [Bacteroidota bacterium]